MQKLIEFMQTCKRRTTAKELFKVVNDFVKELKHNSGQIVLDYAQMQLAQ
jgi:hypothetical protein